MMIEQLEPLVGTWDVETSLGDVRATTTFEWTLGGAFLLQRSEVDLREAPDALCVIAPDGQTGAFRQHYFDSRGVVRLYAMTFDGRTWTLRREAPDFTPLGFAQRFGADVNADRMAGAWETGTDGTWEKDFDMVYTRVR